jgi:phage tail-like protein
MKHSEIAYLLPGIFQRTLGPESPMDAMLCAMETLHAPVEEILEQLDSICASHRTPEAFVPFLARWVDLERIFAPREEADNVISTGLGRLRELIRSAAYLSKWRGTRQGLQRFLETATGVTGFLIEEPPAQPFHLRIIAPQEVEVHRALIERIVDVERPVYATWEVQFGGKPAVAS